MRKSKKLLLTLPSLCSFFYFLVFAFPSEFNWVFPNWTSYYIQMVLLNGLVLFISLYLIVRIWRFKKIDRSKKSIWTFLIIFFTTFGQLYYIWKKDAEFISQNNAIDTPKSAGS